MMRAIVRKHTVVLAAVLALFCQYLLISTAVASNEAVGEVLRQRFEAQAIETGSSELDSRKSELEAFYAGRSFKPIWVRDNGPKGKAKALLVELGRSSVHGLEPSLYRTGIISGLMEATDPEKLADLELLFSGALFEYAHDLSNGRVTRDKAPDQNMVSPIRHGVDFIFDGAERAGELRVFISSLLHVDDRYVRLIAKIAEIKSALDAGMWPELAERIKAVEQDQSDPVIAAIRRHLMLTGDLPVDGNADSARFDRGFGDALTRYQARNGLEVTGRLDEATRTLLSSGAEGTIEKIGINLERRRWQNRELGSDHIYVNLADASVRLVRKGEKVFEARLIDEPGLEKLATFFGRLVGLKDTKHGPGLVVAADVGEETPQLVLLSVDDPADELSALLGARENKSDNGLIAADEMTVFVTYVTAWANKDGSVHFRPDRYGRDDPVRASLKR